MFTIRYFKNVLLHIFEVPLPTLGGETRRELPGRVYSISYCVTISCAKNNFLSF